MVVVADAGMLSAANLNALEDAGFSFIVGSRISKAPYDLAEHFERTGTHFTDGQILESTRLMGTGKAARTRRVVYQYLFARHKHDDRAINAMVERAEKVAAGKRPLKKDRFVKSPTPPASVDRDLVERARQLAGLKGYVTNLAPATMDGAAVVAAYHDLWQVERSFRMTKSDLAARPVFHRLTRRHRGPPDRRVRRARRLPRGPGATGLTSRRSCRPCGPLRSATISLGGQHVTAPPQIPADAQRILDALGAGGH